MTDVNYTCSLRIFRKGPAARLEFLVDIDVLNMMRLDYCQGPEFNPHAGEVSSLHFEYNGL